MPEIKHFWTIDSPYQATGTTVDWAWPIEENQHYWGYSIRPFQANGGSEIIRQWTTSDNNSRFLENFTVRSLSGGLIRFSALGAIGS